jgi:hypothetical protein
LVDKETMIEPKEVEKYSDVNNTIMDKGIRTERVKQLWIKALVQSELQLKRMQIELL